ncbi:MAG: hypothetical protein E7575_02950 [Ruminococcaceae bacterium]|nr:hypothetical protein [Oscillospiraceae bacterium]
MPEGVRGTAPSAPQMQARPPIDKLSVRRAAELLEKYKSGKAKLEARIVENEQFWKLKQWETHKKDNTAGRPSATAVLWNCIASKHADFMDGYPSPNVLPRMADDEEEAKLLSDVIPCVLRQGGFREAYDECSLEKLKQGCGIYGVFWDPDLHGGIGDIVYKSIDPLMLFWEPGKTDLQKSSNVFLCDLVDNETLKNQYPDILKDKTLSLDKNVSKYIYEDSVDTSNMSLVVDWYYKKRIGGQDVLHFAKFVGDTLLYSTENAGLPYLYAHGRYPFEPDTLHRIKGTWFGFGYIDIGKGDQTIIDELSECIVKNTKWGVKPRYLSKMGGGINEKEFADLSREIVHFEGQSTDIKPVDYKPLQGNYLAFMESKIALLKECTGNRDVNNGGTVSGVTAASGIAAMQESGSKLSRDAISGTYHAFEKVIYLTIELMREKYDSKRYFRITGDSGQAEYIEYTNALLRGQDQTVAGGTSVGLRRPEFDIIVTAEKASPYKKIERNELMMSLYGMGILQPQNAPAAMQLLSLMDFEGKERIMAKVAENGTLNDRLLQYQQLALDLATEYDPALAEEIAMAIESGMPRESAPTLKSSGKSSAESRLERVRDEAQERSQPG